MVRLTSYHNTLHLNLGMATGTPKSHQNPNCFTLLQNTVQLRKRRIPVARVPHPSQSSDRENPCPRGTDQSTAELSGRDAITTRLPSIITGTPQSRRPQDSRADSVVQTHRGQVVMGVIQARPPQRDDRRHCRRPAATPASHLG